MSEPTPKHCFTAISQPREYCWPRANSLKRKLAPSPNLASFGDLTRPLAYPSPPMSSPPSPPRTLPLELTSGPGQLPTTSTTTHGPIASFVPALATSLPSTQAGLPPQYAGQAFANVPYTSTPPITSAAQLASFQQPTGPQGVSLVPSLPVSSSVAEPSVRGGRRSKTHVASACINCKRAHLSCDVQRPCGRCVASGKQVSHL